MKVPAFVESEEDVFHPIKEVEQDDQLREEVVSYQQKREAAEAERILDFLKSA